MKLKFHIHNQGNVDKERIFLCLLLFAIKRDNCIFMYKYPGGDNVNELCALEWRFKKNNLTSFEYNLLCVIWKCNDKIRFE